MTFKLLREESQAWLCMPMSAAHKRKGDSAVKDAPGIQCTSDQPGLQSATLTKGKTKQTKIYCEENTVE